MAILLNIETSTKVCSLALHQDGILIALKESFESNSHSETIMQFIQQILTENNIKQENLSAIAVSKGPGSYTGLRIGVSTAKGLCYGLNIPLISVDTLQSLTHFALEKLNHQKGIYIPMLDARRMEIYMAVYDEKLSSIEPVSAQIIDENSFSAYLEENKVFVFCDGAEKLKGTILHDNFVVVDEIYTSSNYMGKLSYHKFIQQEFEDVAYFEPYYLKEFMTKPSTKKLL